MKTNYIPTILELSQAVKPFTVIYNFSDKRMGFQNEVTVKALSKEQALYMAKEEVSKCYGSAMLPKFSFKQK
jgi:hypothetical protein